MPIGFLAFAISMFAVTMVLINFDVVDIVYNNYIQMLTTSIIVTYVLSIILGLKARSAPVYDYALPDGSTSCIYDFFMGKELNPRLSKYFDIKMFLELRPGVIGWVNISGSFFCRLSSSETEKMKIGCSIGVNIWF